jgi:5-methylthioadenosine/S-adenosylhomocysteine deaminase
MQKADHIIYGDYVIPVEGDVIRDGALAVQGGTIADIGPSSSIKKRYESESIIGGGGRAVMPGLINTHTHAAMVFLRGIADDLPLMEWLEKHIWPKENKWLGPEFIRDAIRLACLEMLKAGITTFNDMYFFEDEAASAIKEVGMRAVLGSGILDFPTKAAKNQDEYISNAERFIEKWKGDSLITPSIAPHALYTCNPEGFKKAADIAEKYDVPIHIHLSETKWEVEEIKRRHGKTPGVLLGDIGFLSGRVVAAHCVWVTDEDIEAISKAGAFVSHCVESNLKLASGIAPVEKMIKAGIKVSFGTDGAASNNDLNIFSEMSTAAKLHKAASGNPTALNAKTVIKMATQWGADSLGLGDKIGSLERGKTADIIIINLEKPHLLPLYNIYSHLVYSVRASDVETVLVGGRVVVRDGGLTSVSEEEIMEKTRQWSEKIGAD